jgi:hypothetical protein
LRLNRETANLHQPFGGDAKAASKSKLQKARRQNRLGYQKACSTGFSGM